MKSYAKILFVTPLLVFMAVQDTLGQQLPQFSQYIFNGLHINPGYAGYKNEGYVQSTYRSQWVGFDGAPTTFTVTADLSANEGLMGFGISVLADEIGPTRTTSSMLTYAYRIQTGKESFLGLGASAGISQYRIDASALRPVDEIDAELPVTDQNLFSPNLNVGLFYHSNRFYAGFSTYNMMGRKVIEREDIALAFNDLHFYITMGALLPISDNIQFKPSFLIKEIKGAPTNYDINGMFLFMERLWLGGSFRSNVPLGNDNLQPSISRRNAVAFIAELFATPQLRIGYAYDYNLNILQNMRTNSHEFSLGYYLSPRKATIKNPRWF
jgi:type IX secretion system PorP/SprF family membrane protein